MKSRLEQLEEIMARECVHGFMDCEPCQWRNGYSAQLVKLVITKLGKDIFRDRMKTMPPCCPTCKRPM